MCGESGVVVNAAFLFLAFVCPLCGLKRDSREPACQRRQAGARMNSRVMDFFYFCRGAEVE